MPTFKVVFLGEARTGKTRFVTECLNTPTQSWGPDSAIYRPTIGASVRTYDFNGHRFNIWDTAGNDKLGQLREGYLIGADIAFVFRHGPEDDQKWTKYANDQGITKVVQVDPQIFITRDYNTPWLEALKLLL